MFVRMPDCVLGDVELHLSEPVVEVVAGALVDLSFGTILYYVVW